MPAKLGRSAGLCKPLADALGNRAQPGTLSEQITSGAIRWQTKPRTQRRPPPPSSTPAPELTAAPETATDTPKQDAPGNAAKPVDDWVTGDEPMTGAQASYLKTLSEEAGEDFDPNLNKADASKRIEALQGTTGRGA